MFYQAHSESLILTWSVLSKLHSTHSNPSYHRHLIKYPFQMYNPMNWINTFFLDIMMSEVCGFFANISLWKTTSVLRCQLCNWHPLCLSLCSQFQDVVHHYLSQSVSFTEMTYSTKNRGSWVLWPWPGSRLLYTGPLCFDFSWRHSTVIPF